jgi:hypothetical protein
MEKVLEISAFGTDFSVMPTGAAYLPCPDALWDRLCRDDATCTFYQTRAWLTLTAGYLSAQGGDLATAQGPVVIPFLRKRRYASWHYFSPFGTYTAPVTPVILNRDSKLALTQALARVNVLLTSSPFTANAVHTGQPLDYTIQVVDLAALDPVNPMRDWDEGQRRRVRVSRRNGVTLRPAQSEADWRRYFELYQESQERWGDATTLSYPWSFFESIRRELEGNPAMTLWLAEVPITEAPFSESRDLQEDLDSPKVIAAGYLTFYHNRHVVPWHGAGGKAFFRHGVTQALFHHIIADACRRQFAHFDLTGSSGLTGVAAFKSRFGTHDVTYQGSLNRVGLYGLLARAKTTLSFKRADASHLPNNSAQTESESGAE